MTQKDIKTTLLLSFLFIQVFKNCQWGTFLLSGVNLQGRRLERANRRTGNADAYSGK